jgi:hypothetical protein
MEETYFESFLKLLDNNLILKQSTAIGVMVKFKNYIKEIKSETLKELQTKGDNGNYYLDYLINEIEKQDYLKDIDVSYVQNWLDEYKITIEEIFNMQYQGNAIEAFIDRHYVDIDKRSEDKDKAFSVQTSFLYYFCNFYAAELITFLKSLTKADARVKENPIKVAESKIYKDGYFEDLLKYISSTKYLYESCFWTTYSYELLPMIENVIIEIEENLFTIPENKADNYISILIKKIEYCGIAEKDEKLIKRWINEYNLDINEFPFMNVLEIKKLIVTHPTDNRYEGKELFEVEDIQIDFYQYACMIGAKKVIEYLLSKKTIIIIKDDVNIRNTWEKIKWIGKPSQLGFIIGKLAELGYIETPERQTGDINYTQLAKLVKNTFDVETTEATLSKYLNLESEKGSETARKFNENGFNIPHVKTIS